MKIAYTTDNKRMPIPASASAPAQAVCRYCGGVVLLRHRQRMNNGGVAYFWRHRDNHNRGCQGRRRPAP